MGRKKIHVGKRPEMPTGSLVIETYASLAEKAKSFAFGKISLLVIAGDPGNAKSHTILKAIRQYGENDFAYIEGNASAFGAYVMGWKKRNKLTLIDDADPLTGTPDGRRYLKQIGQSDQWKHMSWQSKAMMGKKAPAPPEYWTESKVCIITNQWEFRSGNIHTQAVEDRGICFLFAPPSLEIHKYVATWYWDQEVFDFIAKHLPFLKKLSCRLYIKAAEIKHAHWDWKEYILGQMFVEGDTEFEVLRLLEAKKDWRDFVEAGLGSRATWFRYKEDLESRTKLGEVPYYTLTGMAPGKKPDPMELLGIDAEEEGEEEDTPEE